MLRHRRIAGGGGLPALLLFGVVAACVAFSASAATASAATWAEEGDAGSLTVDAQLPTGSGSLDAITGGIDNTRFGDADEDVYAVCSTGTGFSATTATGADPKLYLFGADGRLVAFNDDYSSSESRLVVASPSPGRHYLAIVAYPERAKDANGTSISEPGEGPLAAWSEDAADSFSYTVDLAGAEFCPVARPPAAAGDAYEHNGSDTALVVGPADGVLANDTDADGDALTASVQTAPSHGSLTLSSDGSFRYQPREDFVGSDTFAYTANDGSSESGAGIVVVTVHPGCAGRRATAVGSDGADTIRGSAGADVIAGLGGDDKLRGADGSDLLCGGGGDDKLKGESGDDHLDGGSGDDALWGAFGDDTLLGAEGRDRVDGHHGDDAVSGGSGGADVCRGDKGVDSHDGTCERSAGFP